MKRNEHFARLKAGYLFPEINKRRTALMQRRPDAKVISLGIGNTTEPLFPHITAALERAAKSLGTREGYSGYGDSQGMMALRESVARVIYKDCVIDKDRVQPDEVFIADGSKCDIGRLQQFFGPKVTFAVQDPTYPVFVDGSVMAGQTGEFDDASGHFQRAVYLRCVPENNFFPDLTKVPRTDVIYFCSPNNPTGVVATRAQLQDLVDFARKNRSILVFDGAYAMFVRDASFPRSIYEIDGAKEIAIELGSFSKPAGFTGVRLGWCVVPHALKYDDGGSVRADWDRMVSTIFNGACNIAQHGGLAALEPQGLKEMQQMIAFYLENAALLHKALASCGIEMYGGTNSPYVWARFPGKSSWQSFEELLEKALLVTTPGSGFGPAGEGFVRLSAFGKRSDIEEACVRLNTFLQK